ncbi:MAG: hypothetical protein ACUVR0_09815 [Candidatus Aminicenantales bacterium]
MWINLTGGNNVINAALELAAMLSGDVARMYYVQAEKCVRYTAEDGYWVDLPVMPLALGRLSRAIIDLVADPQRSPIPQADLYGILQSEYWDLSRGLTSEEVLRENYLSALWKQGLTAETPDGYVVGPHWELIRPYQDTLEKARQAGLNIEALALDRSPIIYSLLGMKDEAVKAIQKEISEGVLYPYLSLINDPRFRNLEDDPRFRSIVARAENSRKIFLKKYGSYF